MERLIFHIDVNNAFLSWTAVDLLKKGYPIDIREIPAVIGGDEDARRGIVTAKSPVAKKMGVVTAESLYTARKKCPGLKVFKGDYELYHRNSNQLYKYFCGFTDKIERYSIDECFLDMTGTELMYPDPIKLAHKMKDEIYEKFGYTVNVGIANNKLCAKMASDFEKPNKVHTLFSYEIEKKMWPLPVGDLFMIGKRSSKELLDMGINTIGDLAKYDINILKRRFKSMGIMMHEYANGIDFSEVAPRTSSNKSISTTETLPNDIDNIVDLRKILEKQANKVGRQIRKQKLYATTIAVIFKTKDFVSYSHQMKLPNPTSADNEIYNYAKEVLNKGWKKEPIRLIGIRLGDFTKYNDKQMSIFDEEKQYSNDKIQEVLDNISDKYGDNVIMPASYKMKDK